MVHTAAMIGVTVMLGPAAMVDILQMLGNGRVGRKTTAVKWPTLFNA